MPKFDSSVRVDIRRIGAMVVGDQVIGGRERVEVLGVAAYLGAPIVPCPAG